MDFFILEGKMTPNIWHENDISSYDKDNLRDWNDPLYPRPIFNQPPFCPLCGHSLRLYDPPPLRRQIEVARPYFADIVIHGDDMYCSERCRDLFMRSDIQGIERFRKIEILAVLAHNGVRKAKLPPLPVYHLAEIAVDGAAVDDKRSQSVFDPPLGPVCGYCTHGLGERGKSRDKHIGLYVDIARWNGYDISRILGTGGTLFATRLFKDFVEENGLTVNFHFRLESEDCRDWDAYDENVEETGEEGLRYDLVG